MTKLIWLTLLVCAATVCPLSLILAQDDDLPYNPFLEQNLERNRTKVTAAVRDLGGARMDTVVGVPSEVKNDIRVTKKISANGGRPIIILVYGRKEMMPQDGDMAEELQRKEIERRAFKEGLRDTNIEVRRELKGPAVADAVPVK
jgi:hypothetical protein